jgi:S-adenosyl-L-methionine hydrolase (adenosine-forming)
MADPIVTLTTDFGTESPYVAAVKGVLLGIDPTIRVIDLSHDISPRDVRQAAYFLASALPYFPKTALHLVVVDPGVGTERAILYVEVGDCRLLVPDNGCWTFLPDGGRPPSVVRLQEPRYWRKTVSNTFHGRDIFAPVAGHLSLGGDPRFLGPAVTDWVRLPRSEPKRETTRITGQVVVVDHFGNLITNISRSGMADVPAKPRVFVGPAEVQGWVRAYGEAAAGTLVALFSSEGYLELAVALCNAAKVLGVGVGAEVEVSWN